MVQEISLDTIINLGTFLPLIAIIYQVWKSRRERKQQNQLKTTEILINEFKARFEDSKGVVYDELLKEFLNLYFKILEKPLLYSKETEFRKSLSMIFKEMLNFGEDREEFAKKISSYIISIS